MVATIGGTGTDASVALRAGSGAGSAGLLLSNPRPAGFPVGGPAGLPPDRVNSSEREREQNPSGPTCPWRVLPPREPLRVRQAVLVDVAVVVPAAVAESAAVRVEGDAGDDEQVEASVGVGICCCCCWG